MVERERRHAAEQDQDLVSAELVLRRQQDDGKDEALVARHRALLQQRRAQGFALVFLASGRPGEPVAIHAMARLGPGDSAARYFEDASRRLETFDVERLEPPARVHNRLRSLPHRVRLWFSPEDMSLLVPGQTVGRQDHLRLLEYLQSAGMKVAVRIAVEMLCPDVAKGLLHTLRARTCLARLESTGTAAEGPPPLSDEEMVRSLCRCTVDVLSSRELPAWLLTEIQQDLATRNGPVVAEQGTETDADFDHRLRLRPTRDAERRGLVHLANVPALLQFPLATHSVPFVRVTSRPLLEAPTGRFDRGLRLGTVAVPGRGRVPFSLGAAEQTGHVAVFGKTGTGKSTALRSICESAMLDGDQAVFILDPHGDLVEDLRHAVPAKLADRVVYLDFTRTDVCPGINVLESSDEQERAFLIGELDHFLLELFGPEIWGPRLQDLFRNLALALALDPKGPGTLPDLLWATQFHENDKVRQWLEGIVSRSGSHAMAAFLKQVMSNASGSGSVRELVPYFRAKFSPLVDNVFMSGVLGQSRSTIDFARLARERRVVLMNLGKGQMSSRNCSLLGAIICLRIFQTAIAQGRRPREQRVPVLLVMDEFQSFVSSSVSDMLAEARKYNLRVVLANQFLAQLDGSPLGQIRSSRMLAGVLGNVGTLLSFRVSARDAELVSEQFGRRVAREDLTTLASFKAVCSTAERPPFLVQTEKPSPRGRGDVAAAIVKRSAEVYCRPRTLVDLEQSVRFAVAFDNPITLSGSPEPTTPSPDVATARNEPASDDEVDQEEALVNDPPISGIHLRVGSGVQVDQDRFLRLLAGSISLTIEEKEKIIESMPKLSQRQIDELLSIFATERDSFQELAAKHHDQIHSLRLSHAHDWRAFHARGAQEVTLVEP